MVNPEGFKGEGAERGMDEVLYPNYGAGGVRKGGFLTGWIGWADRKILKQDKWMGFNSVEGILRGKGSRFSTACL
jgi:hypothetical protein